MEENKVELEKAESFVHEKDRSILRKRTNQNCKVSIEDVVAHINYERGLVKDFSLYTIQYGDTLSEIGERFNLDYNRIAFVNGIANCDQIREGHLLSFLGVK